MDDLAGRVARLEAIEAARALVARYADCIDTIALGDLRSLFADDMVLTMPGRRYEGAEAVVQFYRERLNADTAAGRHFVTNMQVVSASAEAVTLASLFLFTAGKEGASHLGWGRYTDQFAVVDGSLRFVAKEIVVEHRGPVQATWGASSTGGGG